MSSEKGSDLAEFDSEYDDYEEYLSRPLFSRRAEKLSAKSRSPGEATTTLPCDKRFPPRKQAAPEQKPKPRTLLDLSPSDRRYYRHVRKIHGIRYLNLDYVPLDPNLDPLPRRCFSCWKVGHASRACPRPQIALFCRNCGRRDVDLEDCPRCSRAHREERAKNDAAAALREATDARKDAKKASRGADPLADASLLVNEGSEASDASSSRRPLEAVREGFETKLDFTRDMLSDVKKLMDAVRHLSVTTQDRVLSQWLTERERIE